MRRAGLVFSGALVGLVGLLGYRAATPSLPAFVVSPSASTGSSTTAPPATTTTTAAPPPQNSTTTSPPRTSTTTHVPTTTAPPTTTTHVPTTTAPPTTTLPAPTTTTTAPSATRSVTGESVNYIYGVLSVQVTATGSKISKVKIGSIDDGGNYRSVSIDQMAIPQLEQETLAAQSANIQAVSGASYTSAGFRQSLQSALTKLGL
jgi:uncharacterized protein with FMN-binding domain